MIKIKILGVGAPSGDDRLGWEAVQALRNSEILNAAPPGRVEIAVLDRPGAMLLAHWRDAGAVILIDAVRSGAEPGRLHRLEAADLAAAGAMLSSHGFGVVSALELGEALGEMPAATVVHGIEMDPAWSADTLSPAVAAALPRLLRELERETVRLLEAGGG